MNSAERLCLVAARSEALLADFVVLFLIRWGLKYLGVEYFHFQPVLGNVSPPISIDEFQYPLSALFWGSMYFVSGLPELILAGMWVLYSTICIAMFGKTIGMRQAGITLVDQRGRKPGLAKVLVRQLVAPFSSILWIGYWPMIFLPHASTLHDLVSRTHLVYVRKPAVDATAA